MSEEYRIVFRGATRDGFRHDEVRAKASRRLKVTDRQLERMFSGRPIILKKGLDEAGGRNYLHQLQKLGLDAVLEQVNASSTPIATPAHAPGHKTDNRINESSFVDFNRTQINLSQSDAVLNDSTPAIIMPPALAALIRETAALPIPAQDQVFSTPAPRAPVTVNSTFVCNHCGAVHQLEASIQIKSESRPNR